MSDTLYTLHNEHAKFEELLSLIEQQVTALQRGPTPDYELVLNSMQVIGQYLSYIHHPMEHLIVEKLLERSGRARSLLEPFITQDWRYFNEHHAAFLDSLDSALNGAFVSREALISRGRDSIADLRREIQVEERAVFPLAIQLLREQDWIEINTQLNSLNRWTLGEVLKSEYRALQERTTNQGHATMSSQ
jgi:hemerythrin-like domain-containing protein